MSRNPLNAAMVAALPLMPRTLVWRISRRYIAGVSLADALATVKHLNERGVCATLDVLGEDVSRPDQVAEAAALYRRALDLIAEQRLDCNVSIKLSEMGLRFDEELCRRTMADLVARAEDRGNFVRIDMEDSSVTDVTLDIYRELRSRYPRVGTVLQACLRRTSDDVAALLAEGVAHLRLCKGIYIEPAEIAFTRREDVAASFRQLLEALLAGGCEKLGIATHDPALVRDALAALERMAVPRGRYEFQMLLGVAERLRDELVDAGHPLRVYVPFGEHGFAYSSRRLRENPTIAGHVAKNLFLRR
ncbi:MAG: proline dehydrogenase family protein [Pseudomonadota bacterium]